MRKPRILCRLALVLHLAASAAVAEPLRFSLPEGGMQNEFYRDGPVAAHVVLRPGPEPRVVVAFPAGNSGAAVWFDAEGEPFAWKPDVVIEPASRAVEGGTLRGVSAVLRAAGGAVTVREVVTGSIRVIREADDGLEPPPATSAVPRRTDSGITWLRRRIDGAPGYLLSIDVLRGRMTGGPASAVTLHPDERGDIELRVTALTGEPPLTPLPADELVAEGAAPDLRLRRILAYLSYREKLLAGSWQFATYFGRDTLMSLVLLAPAAEPELVEAGLGAVLERLNAAGEVAHEEAIGEFALLGRGSALDYKMIDDDFMLAVVAAHFLLQTNGGRERAATFLARAAGPGETNGSALARNARFVLSQAAPFARDPAWRRLISLKPGQEVGNWRDSNLGLGGGKFPFDVNGIFVPAALDAVARLHASGLLKAYVGPRDDEVFREAATMAAVWRREAPRYFDVRVDTRAARAAVIAYAGAIGIDAAPALAEIGTTPVNFRAVSLDAEGRPVSVLNSDEAFALLFGDIAPADAERIAETLLRPFPAGLLTDVGLLVANPAFAPAPLQPAFDRNRYHGTVAWSWQQAMFRAGIDRQLARRDLPDSTRAVLVRAGARLRHAIKATDAMRGSELWSWTQTGGVYRAEPFGQSLQHETESNAAQLWSTVHLAWPAD